MMRPGASASTTLYCTHCDWEKADASSSCANVCPRCQQYGLRWVRFQPGEEDAQAAAVMAWQREHNPTNQPHFSGQWSPELSRVPHRRCPGDE